LAFLTTVVADLLPSPSVEKRRKKKRPRDLVRAFATRSVAKIRRLVPRKFDEKKFQRRREELKW
jgi:hypothetical protein